jgi:hypothetical protein
MRQFYLAYHGHEKLQPLVGEISWSKHLAIMAKYKDPLEREFYIRMTRKFGWSKNVLIHQFENQSYEKTLLSQTNFDKRHHPVQGEEPYYRRIRTSARQETDRRGHLSDRQAAAQGVERPAPEP